MSGGHFQYEQNRISNIADNIDELICKNDDPQTDEWGGGRGRHYSPETLAKFDEAVRTLRRAAIMAQRIDWLVSGDDGEDDFHERWDEELGEAI